jgi:hypothetical protein
MSDEPGGGANSEIVAADNHVVVRSIVSKKESYLDYRDDLRRDFYYSCAYCTRAEFEALGIRFTIDHYEPQSDRPDLMCDYTNLFYACDECNTLKNDLSPPPTAREAGYRFFRSDEDSYPTHFAAENHRVKHLSNVGEFTIETLELNRLSLRRLREIRERLQNTDDFISSGIMALRHYKIDQLPREIRSRALSAIQHMDEVTENTAQAIDTILRHAAKSPYLDNDPDKEIGRSDRREKLSTWKGMHPGKWRGRQNKR